MIDRWFAERIEPTDFHRHRRLKAQACTDVISLCYNSLTGRDSCSVRVFAQSLETSDQGEAIEPEESQ